MTRAILALMLLTGTAYAQKAEPIDPRLAEPMVNTLAAQVAFQKALIEVMKEDQKTRDAALAAWFRGWFGEKPVAEAKP